MGKTSLNGGRGDYLQKIGKANLGKSVILP